MGKEKIACLVIIVLLGGLAYLKFPQEDIASVRANDEGIKLAKIAVPDLNKMALSAPKEGTSFRGRDIFESPRDTTPLPPLALEIPPNPRHSIIAPPLRPSTRVAKWSDFYHVPLKVQNFEFPNVAADTEKKDADTKPAASAGVSGGEDVTARIETYKKLYDWMRPNPNAILFGKIQNPNAFDLGFPKLRDTEQLIFQEVFPETGKMKGKPVNWVAERVTEYGFADSIANRIELKKRKIPYTAGNIAAMIAFADWCVEQGAEEPKGFVEAEKIYKLATQLDAGDPAGQLGLGRFYERSFRLEEAYDLYRGMAEGQFAHRPEPFMHLGKLQAKLRMFDLAEASLRRAVEIDGVNPNYRSALGQFYLDRGRVDEAVAALKELKMESPDPEERAKIRTIVGKGFLAAGDLNEAQGYFKQALNTKPDYLPAHLGMVSCHYAKGNFAEAVQVIDQVLGQGAVSTELYTARGILQTRLGQFANAERDLKSAIGLNPLLDFYPLSALAFLYEMTGHPGEAVQTIEAAATIEPADPYVRYLQGVFAATREDFEGAKPHVDAVLGAELRFVDGLVIRSLISTVQNRNDDAERYLSFACEVSPRNADLWALRSTNLLRAGQLRKALESAQKSLSLNPEHPTSLNVIAYCAYAEGKVEESIRGFADVLDRHKEEDEYRAYADKCFKDIQDHQTKVLWTDNFDRTDLRREWKEEARLGPLVRLENGSVQVDGNAKEPGRTRLYRELPGKAFLSFEATVTVDEPNQSIVGLQVVAEKKIGDTNRVDFEVNIARTRNGKVATRVQVGQVAPEWKIEENLSWPVGQAVKLAVEKVGTVDDPKVRLYFNDQPIGEAEKLQKLRSIAMDIRLGVFAETEAGRQASFKADNARMIYRDK